MREGSTPAQQKTDDPARQDVRLARTRIGRYPDGMVRVGGPALVGNGFFPERTDAFSLRAPIAIAEPGRPFERPGQMIVIAVHVVLARRQCARQIAVCRIGIVGDQRAEALPGFLCQCACGFDVSIVFQDRFSRYRSIGFQADEFQVGRCCRLPTSANAPRASNAPSSASCGASNVCAWPFEGPLPVL